MKGGCWGIAVDTGYNTTEEFDNVVIRGNTIKNVGDVGIGINACLNCTIENNVIIQEQNRGFIGIAVPDKIADKGPEDAKMTNVTVRFNSIYINLTSSSLSQAGLRVYTEGQNHSIYGNTIHFAGNVGTAKCFLYNTLEVNYTTIDYNNCYFSDVPTTYWAQNGSSLLTLSQWQSSGFDGSSSVGDPAFSSPAGPNYDLSISASSTLLIDKVPTNLCPAIDILGNARPVGSMCDIGAYELLIVGPDTTPPRVTIVNPKVGSYYKNSSFPIIFNVTLNENGSVRYAIVKKGGTQ